MVALQHGDTSRSIIIFLVLQKQYFTNYTMAISQRCDNFVKPKTLSSNKPHDPRTLHVEIKLLP